MLTAEQRSRYRGASPGSLAEVLENDPPGGHSGGLRRGPGPAPGRLCRPASLPGNDLPGFPGALYLRP
jgi:hypothetical protein